jgi:hypothetical protein
MLADALVILVVLGDRAAGPDRRANRQSSNYSIDLAHCLSFNGRKQAGDRCNTQFTTGR